MKLKLKSLCTLFFLGLLLSRSPERDHSSLQMLLLVVGSAGYSPRVLPSSLPTVNPPIAGDEDKLIEVRSLTAGQARVLQTSSIVF